MYHSLTILNLKELYSIIITTRINLRESVMSLAQMDAYLEEELYDDLTYSIQNPSGSDFESKKKCIEEIGKDAKPYRSWWNNITPEWKY